VGGTDILTHTLFLINQTGAVTDGMIRMHGEERQDDGERHGITELCASCIVVS